MISRYIRFVSLVFIGCAAVSPQVTASPLPAAAWGAAGGCTFGAAALLGTLMRTQKKQETLEEELAATTNAIEGVMLAPLILGASTLLGTAASLVSWALLRQSPLYSFAIGLCTLPILIAALRLSASEESPPLLLPQKKKLVAA